MRWSLSLLIIGVFFLSQTVSVFAQAIIPPRIATNAAELASQSATQAQPEKTVTEPEETEEKIEVITLLEQRASGELNITNFFPYAVSYAIKAGVPANTIILILLLPLLATIIVIFRYIIGLSGLGLLVPIALSITLLATGFATGFIILSAILLSSYFSRIIFKKIRIMQMPKIALSMFVVSILIIATLTACAAFGIFDVRNLSIFPILLFILLSDRIVALFLERPLNETLTTTAVTLVLGILGYVLLSLDSLRSFILLYPEIILLLVPLNIAIGRYFGLRIIEYIKFRPVLKHGNK
ncbi:MAG TPA: 7TM domain-containing protein [Patescibacteria group bacterium]|nr:7TM domain-containing protein [Patescibacteria group bacterium]